MFQTFQISLTNFFKTRLLLCEQAHIQFSEIGRLPYYEYELTLEAYDEVLKEREEERKKSEEEQQSKMPTTDYRRQANDMMRNAQQSFKMPSMPSMPSLPKL